MSTDIVTKDLDAVDIEISNDESQQQPNDENDDDDNEESDKIMHDSIFPATPSGSMDSLSSNSHSASSNSSPPSFTTFGKDSSNRIANDGDSIGKTSIIFIEDDANLPQIKNSVDAMENGKVKVVVGSSDDDSGFENVKMIKCNSK
jgi:hypothetical protein